MRWVILAMGACNNPMGTEPLPASTDPVDTGLPVLPLPAPPSTPPPPPTPFACEEDPLEDNDTPATARPWPAPDAALAVLRGDPDHWALEVPAWTTLTVDMRHDWDRGDLDLALLTADGTELALAASGSDDERLVLGNYAETPVTWVASVELWDFFPPPCNTYTLDHGFEPLPDCPPDALQSAAPVLLDGPVSAPLNAHPMAPDTYRVAVSTGDAVHVQLQEDALAVGELDVTLLDPAGGVLARDTFGDVYTLDHVYTGAPGELTVEVRATACVDYTLDSAVVPNPGCTVDPWEPDSPLAQVLEAGTPTSGSVGPDDPDVHRVLVPPGAVLEAELHVDGTFGWPLFELVDAGGLLIAADDGQSGTYRLTWHNLGLSAVPLDLRITAEACTDYTVATREIPAPDCTGDDALEPLEGPIGPPPTGAGAWVDGTDTDAFAVEVPGGHALFVGLSTDGAFGSPRLDVTDGTGRRIARDLAGPPWGVRAANTGTPDALWDVAISSPSCMGYDLDSWIVACDHDDLAEPNDTPATARPVAEAVDAWVRPGADDHWALGSVAPGATLTAAVRFAHAAGDLDAELLLADGTVVYDGFTVTDDEVATWTNPGPTAQDLVLRVRHFPSYGATCPVNRYDVELLVP
jgi:hypothetical protein